MPEGPEAVLRPWIETFQAPTRLDLRPLWQLRTPSGQVTSALEESWRLDRPDWHARGLVIWPRGGRWHGLTLQLHCPQAWLDADRADRQARLVLRWWADAAVLRVDGSVVREGDLFDTACRWLLPASWWRGVPLQLDLRLRSPLHDDGALIQSLVELEPLQPGDRPGLLRGTALELLVQRLEHGPEPQRAQVRSCTEGLASVEPLGPAAGDALAAVLQQAARQRPHGGFHVLGHAHLDLAWLWPVADTWQAAVRTFESVLDLMDRHPQLHFAHSTPALYAWIEQHRPALFARIRRAMEGGRWEPINGPWVETDCVLIGTASLLRQFQLGQDYSRRAFPEWRHELCWLPDSFGFAAGLPAVASATGVRWFCTHKLAWNATNPFPHRLFRWRSRCGSELLALITAPIGTDGDPVAMERYRLQWQAATGVDQALWLPGMGDHGGGPTAEMLQQLELWQQQAVACPQRHGTLRDYLHQLEPLADRLPVWRDELYLELHRGCATTRPDQKRHNRSLERLLREADLALALAAEPQPADWRSLLFQQFHDILPGTAIPEVFEQAEPQWRSARRRACQQRDAALRRWLEPAPRAEASPQQAGQPWWLAQLQPLPGQCLTLRLPRGAWSQAGSRGLLPHQPAAGGGVWVQLPGPEGVAALALRRAPGASAVPADPSTVLHPVRFSRPSAGAACPLWTLDNGLLRAEFGAEGLRQLWGADGRPQLATPLEWRRWRDHGEFWDAWDIAASYREHPLPLHWHSGPELAEQGPLCTRLVWRGRCGASDLRLDVQLRAASPWLELSLSVQWRQRHELLRLEIPLAEVASRYAADTSGGVLERPALARTAREQARWEVPALSWVASQAAAGGLAVLLDGPQGVSAQPDRLGVSLLRAPTWPDPSADNGFQRLRLALMPCSGGWRQQAVAQQALRFREPLWLRPASGPQDPVMPPPTGLCLGSPHLQLVGLAPGAAAGEALLTVQNLSPLRLPLGLEGGWQVQGDPDPWLRPWQLASWRVCRPGQSS